MHEARRSTVTFLFSSCQSENVRQFQIERVALKSETRSCMSGTYVEQRKYNSEETPSGDGGNGTPSFVIPTHARSQVPQKNQPRPR